jgi:hypothetical protein
MRTQNKQTPQGEKKRIIPMIKTIRKTVQIAVVAVIAVTLAIAAPMTARAAASDITVTLPNNDGYFMLMRTDGEADDKIGADGFRFTLTNVPATFVRSQNVGAKHYGFEGEYYTFYVSEGFSLQLSEKINGDMNTFGSVRSYITLGDRTIFNTGEVIFDNWTPSGPKEDDSLGFYTKENFREDVIFHLYNDGGNDVHIVFSYSLKPKSVTLQAGEQELPIEDFGRDIAQVLSSAPLMAKPSSTAFVMDGTPVSVPQAYNVSDNNYLQLRAIAVLLNGTSAQFNVVWDGTYAVIETGKAYTGEATATTLKETTNVKQSSTQFKIDGNVVTFGKAYLIDGDTNYLQLREVAEKLSGTKSQFNIYYDEAAKQAVIEPGKAYTGTK